MSEEAYRANGRNVSEIELVDTLLASMPKSYDIAVSGLNLLIEERKTLAYVKTILLAEESRRKDDVFENEQENALVTLDNVNNQCVYRKKLQGKTAKKSFDKKNLKCFKCGSLGHFKRDCTEAKQKEYVATVIEHEAEHAFMLDSGATAHITPDKSILQDYKHKPGFAEIQLGDLSSLKAQGAGTVVLRGDFGKLTLHDVIYVPSIKFNLISVKRLAADDNYDIEFRKDKWKVSGKDIELVV